MQVGEQADIVPSGLLHPVFQAVGSQRIEFEIKSSAFSQRISGIVGYGFIEFQRVAVRYEQRNSRFVVKDICFHRAFSLSMT